MKKHLKFLTTIFLALACALILGACDNYSTEKKYDYLVTFDYNVASVGLDVDNYSDSYLGVNENSIIVAPGNASSSNFTQYFKEQAFNGYYVEGWYLPQTDSDGNTVFVKVLDDSGNVKTDSDGNEVEYAVIDTDKKWNFSTDKVTGDITLYANLTKKASLTIVVSQDTSKNYVRSGVPGDEVDDLSSSYFIPTLSGYTYLGLYADEACTEEISWPITLEEGNLNIYAKYIEGNWKIATTAAEFNAGVTSKMNVYVAADLDFSETEFVGMQDYNAEINGNGHTLESIEVSAATARYTYSNFGLFGTLGSSAYIHDLTIKDATFVLTDEYEVPPTLLPSGIDGVYAALFAYRIDASAKLENLNVSGKLTLVKGKTEIELFEICTNSDFDIDKQCVNCEFNITTEEKTSE